MLTTATCALLGTSVQADNSDWEFDTAFMIYSEADRVSAAEAIIGANKTYGDDEVLSLKLTIDSLTGASANGAVAQPNIQTFTRPSGNGQFNIQPNETPLDDTFKDTRVQLTGQWSEPLENDYTWSIGGNLSKEFDYTSVGINTNISKDLNKKNTTVSMGLAYAFDNIAPEGDIPIAFASMVIGDSDSALFDDAFDATRLTDSDDKTTTDLLLGLTQVINRQMIMQFNYSYSYADGYLTDAFKILSVVDTTGISQDYLYENRPNERTKHSFYWQTKYHFDSSIIDLSYRYMTDDWEIDSHTIDMHYRIPLSDNQYIEPHIRYYKQTAAEFYQPFLNESDALPEYASADYRIGEMSTYTIGLKYSMPLENNDVLSFRLEYYTQSPENAGFTAPGVLADQDLYEGINAVIFQVGYSF